MISDVLADSTIKIRRYLTDDTFNYAGDTPFVAKAAFVLSVMDALRLEPGMDTIPSEFSEKWADELFIGKVRLALVRLEHELAQTSQH